MTNKELRRMSRSELLELLIDQMEENEKLSTELDKVKKQLQERRIIAENCGSIAEAALQLNGIFEAAEAAARQYVESVCSMADERKQLYEKEKADTAAKA